MGRHITVSNSMIMPERESIYPGLCLGVLKASPTTSCTRPDARLLPVAHVALCG
jgi:hypothetical protein